MRGRCKVKSREEKEGWAVPGKEETGRPGERENEKKEN